MYSKYKNYPLKNEFKIVMLGGRSCDIIENCFTLGIPSYVAPGDTTNYKRIYLFNLSIVDIYIYNLGLESSPTKLSCRNNSKAVSLCDAFIIVYDITDDHALKKLIDRYNYYIGDLYFKEHPESKRPPVIVVGNRADLITTQEMHDKSNGIYRQIDRWCKINRISDHIVTSAKEKCNIDEIFHRISLKTMDFKMALDRNDDYNCSNGSDEYDDDIDNSQVIESNQNTYIGIIFNYFKQFFISK